MSQRWDFFFLFLFFFFFTFAIKNKKTKTRSLRKTTDYNNNNDDENNNNTVVIFRGLQLSEIYLSNIWPSLIYKQYLQNILQNYMTSGS